MGKIIYLGSRRNSAEKKQALKFIDTIDALINVYSKNQSAFINSVIILVGPGLG